MVYKQEPNELGEQTTSAIGLEGEKIAADYLRKHGYQIVVRNFKIPIGRNRKGVMISGEIDIIALGDGKLVFLEVKTRTAKDAKPESNVNLRKQRQIIRVARAYRRAFSIQNIDYRYDVLSIILNSRRAPVINHFRGFWTEEKFRKQRWSGVQSDQRYSS